METLKYMMSKIVIVHTTTKRKNIRDYRTLTQTHKHVKIRRAQLFGKRK